MNYRILELERKTEIILPNPFILIDIDSETKRDKAIFSKLLNCQVK